MDNQLNNYLQKNGLIVQAVDWEQYGGGDTPRQWHGTLKLMRGKKLMGSIKCHGPTKKKAIISGKLSLWEQLQTERDRIVKAKEEKELADDLGKQIKEMLQRHEIEIARLAKIVTQLEQKYHDNSFIVYSD